jgi:hypothetical protein
LKRDDSISMISPELSPEVVPARPPGCSDAPLNTSLEQEPPQPNAGRLAMATGTHMSSRRSTQVVVNGLWPCLLGSVAAGLAVSAVLGGLVLVISFMG